jgi:hypothetical protein
MWPIAAPLGRLEVDLSEASQNVIDWTNSYPGHGRSKAPAGNASRWVADFVNHMGQSETQRNPNASLRVHIPAVSKALSSHFSAV